MKTRKIRRRVKRRRTAPKPESAAPACEDLNAASRALLGEDSGERAMRPAPQDASIQAPLFDWPED